MAACLAVALGLWSGGADQRAPTNVAATSKPAAVKDRIFTARDSIFASSSDSRRPPVDRRGDELFRANFSGS